MAGIIAALVAGETVSFAAIGEALIELGALLGATQTIVDFVKNDE